MSTMQTNNPNQLNKINQSNFNIKPPIQPYQPYTKSQNVQQPSIQPTFQPNPQPVYSQQQQPLNLEDKLKEKVNQYLKPKIENLQKDIEKETEIQNKLEERTKILETKKEDLEKKKKEVEKRIEMANEELESLNKFIEEQKDQNIDPNDLIEAKDPYSDQGMKCMAERDSLEDVMYYLDEALFQKKIGAESYVENVRELAREVYKKKVLLRKIKIEKEKFDQKIHEFVKNKLNS
jgi:chromosome segregation ATPase